ncbi:MAG: heparan-alpha-glucosaminide N-acetyltransferase domain-containing protein [Bacteroidia bacterium]
MLERTHTADLLKGIAALLMIQVHIIELFATTTIFESNAGKLLLFLGGPPVAPVFLALLGYFIASSNKSTQQQITRGVKIIVLGLVLNVALNFNLIVSVLKGKYTTDLMPYIFGVDVLPHAGLSLILIALLPKIVKQNPLALIALAFAVVFSGELLIHYSSSSKVYTHVLAFVYGTVKWSYFPLLPWFAYSLVGMAFYNIIQRYDFSILNAVAAKIILIVGFTLFMLFSFPYAVSVASNLQEYYHHGMLFFVWTISFLLLYSFTVSSIAPLIEHNFIANYLQWLGKNITAIYVIQWILIGNIATEIYQSISSPSSLLISFVLVATVSSLVVYGWRRVRA